MTALAFLKATTSAAVILAIGYTTYGMINTESKQNFSVCVFAAYKLIFKKGNKIRSCNEADKY